jgi:hypothetical protein
MRLTFSKGAAYEGMLPLWRERTTPSRRPRGYSGPPSGPSAGVSSEVTSREIAIPRPGIIADEGIPVNVIGRAR